jgi:hypothetical protein
MRMPAFLVVPITLVLLCTACVPSSDVPPVTGTTPTPAPSVSPQALVANPSSLTLSASALPPGGVYPSITVTQNAASSPPVVISAQSTCLTLGYTNIVSSSANGSSGTFQVQGTKMGNCVLVFGGVNGTTLTVPVTITS